jgi:Flp pilus assembly protein CpaB
MRPAPKTSPTWTTRQRLSFRRIRRSAAPLAFWTATLLVAIVSSRIVQSSVVENQAPFGPVTLVAVAASELPIGHLLGPEDMAVAELPTKLLSHRATANLSSLVGTRLIHAVRTGQPIDRDATTSAATSALAAKIGPEHHGVMIDFPGTLLPLEPGDHVDVLVARDGDGITETAAANATVIERRESSVLLRIQAAQVDTLAGALARGRPLIVVRGG